VLVKYALARMFIRSALGFPMHTFVRMGLHFIMTTFSFVLDKSLVVYNGCVFRNMSVFG
jgi:hypothetical protein